jgi:hypothetical protein
LSIFRQFLRPIDLENPMHEQQETKEDIGVNSIRPDNGETDHTNIARSFLRLTNLDSCVFERLGRYETNLWRQTIQILLLLQQNLALKIILQMNVNRLGGCREGTDDIRRLVSIRFGDLLVGCDSNGRWARRADFLFLPFEFHKRPRLPLRKNA